MPIKGLLKELVDKYPLWIPLSVVFSRETSSHQNSVEIAAAEALGGSWVLGVSQPIYFAESMDPILFEAVIAGDGKKISLFEPDFLLLQVSSLESENTVAHIAARLGHHSIFELLRDQCQSLLFKPNSEGDTPLHVAARAGQVGIVKLLLEYYKSRDIERGDGRAQQPIYLRMQNTKGNTALHEALENNQEQVAHLLVAEDPELSFLVNNKGKPPAYLAAKAGLPKLLDLMLRLLGDSHDLSQWGGNTPLHAAIIRRHRESLESVLRHKPWLIQVTDRQGRNPLHYAASIGYYDGLIEILNIDTKPAYQPDEDGCYPIQMAASSGHINIIQLLLKHCQGSWALLDSGDRNILHAAAQSGKENVVRYILKKPEFSMLINERDVNGNTPLHLATKGWRPKVVGVLTRDSRVNMGIMNNSNLTALDIAETRIVRLDSFRKILTLTALRTANAPRAQNLEVFDGNDRANYGFQPPTTEFYKDRVNTLLLVSTLVATVTFTAGFTVPGGLNGGSPDQGIATRLSNTKFKAFVISDAIALFCSILAVVSLIWAQLGDVSLMRSIIGFTLPLLGISLSMMTVAFGAGLYIVTSRLHWLAHSVLIMSIIFVICTLALLLPLRMRIGSKHGFFQSISYYFLCLLVSATRDDGDSNDDITTMSAELPTETPSDRNNDIRNRELHLCYAPQLRDRNNDIEIQELDED